MATILLLVALLIALPTLWCCCKPRRRIDEPLERVLGAATSAVRERLQLHVRFLAEEIGARSPLSAAGQARVVDYLTAAWTDAGYAVSRQPYRLQNGVEVVNLYVVRRGNDPARGAIVVGAHYDTVPGSPGADDNATGVALLLEISRALPAGSLARDVYFALFACEEPPYFQTEDMGSKRFADALIAGGTAVEAMISLESLGYYRDEKGSQKYPPIAGLFFPSRGNFVAVVGNTGASALVTRVGKLLIEHSKLPVECAALPGWVTGVDWSDHWSFAGHGVAAVMLTDTAPFRNPHYHEASDLPDTLHFGALTALAESLPSVIVGLAEK